MDRTLHEIRRRILRKLARRIDAARNDQCMKFGFTFTEGMKFGFTFIQRGKNGAVEDAALEPFDSFVECCSAAERALKGATPRTLERVEVVPCEYDKSRCHPEMMAVMKTFRPSGQ